MSNYYDYRYADRSNAASSSSATPSWVLGMLAGAAVGGGLALLFAPRQGADTRHQLASRGQAAGRQIKQAYDSAAGTARRSAQRLTDQAKHLTDQAKTWRGEHATASGAHGDPLTGSTVQAVPGAIDSGISDAARAFRDAVGDVDYPTGTTGTRSPLA